MMISLLRILEPWHVCIMLYATLVQCTGIACNEHTVTNVDQVAYAVTSHKHESYENLHFENSFYVIQFEKCCDIKLCNRALETGQLSNTSICTVEPLKHRLIKNSFKEGYTLTMIPSQDKMYTILFHPI